MKTFLCTIVCLTALGCGSRPTPEERYNTAIQIHEREYQHLLRAEKVNNKEWIARQEQRFERSRKMVEEAEKHLPD